MKMRNKSGTLVQHRYPRKYARYPREKIQVPSTPTKHKHEAPSSKNIFSRRYCATMKSPSESRFTLDVPNAPMYLPRKDISCISLYRLNESPFSSRVDVRVRRHFDEVSCRYPRTLYHCDIDSLKAKIGYHCVSVSVSWGSAISTHRSVWKMTRPGVLIATVCDFTRMYLYWSHRHVKSLVHVCLLCNRFVWNLNNSSDLLYTFHRTVVSMSMSAQWVSTDPRHFARFPINPGRGTQGKNQVGVLHLKFEIGPNKTWIKW